MRKIAKFLVISAILTVLFAMPVMAREVSFSSENTDYLITLLKGNEAKLTGALNEYAKVQAGPSAQAAIARQTAIVNSQIAAVNKECSQNHIQFLNTRLNNAKKVEATRLNQLNYFKGLYAVSSSWAPQVAVAQAEYDSAAAITASVEADLAAAKVKLAPYL
ncbi:MAG: hypothetical protein K6F34_05405 [Lachnospiraceae bacterium]|nr:hypothetical protein [Lachnospiraceae bacterium]